MLTHKLRQPRLQLKPTLADEEKKPIAREGDRLSAGKRSTAYNLGGTDRVEFGCFLALRLEKLVR